MSKRLQEFIAQFEAEYKRGENIEALARLLVDENPHWIKSVNANRSQTARTLVRQYRRKLAQSGLKIPR